MTEYDDKSYYEIQLEQKQLVLILLLMVAICVLFFFLGVYYVKGREPMQANGPSTPNTADRGSKLQAPDGPESVEGTTRFFEDGDGKANAPKEEVEGGRVVAESLPAPERTPAIPPVKDPKTSLRETRPSPPPAAAVSGGFVVQIAAVSDAERANKVESELKAKGFPSHIKEVSNADGARLFKVRVGPYSDRAEADKAKDGLRGQGYGGAFVSSDD